MEELAKHYASYLEISSPFWIEKKSIAERILDSASTPQELERLITESYYAQSGFHKRAENFATMCNRQHAPKLSALPNQHPGVISKTEALAFEENVISACADLHKLIGRRLSQMSTEMNIPFSYQRTLLEADAFKLNYESEYTSDYVGLFPQHGSFPSKGWNQATLKTSLYDDSDLLDALRSIKEDNVHTRKNSLEEMQVLFHSLHPKFKHVGTDDIDDIDDMGHMVKEAFIAEHSAIGEAVLVSGSSLAARQYSKHGVPSNLRPQLWDLMLQSDITESYPAYASRVHQRLLDKASQCGVLADTLVQLDSKHAANDDSYFVFEDTVRHILMLWTHDEWLQQAVIQDEVLPVASEWGFRGHGPQSKHGDKTTLDTRGMQLTTTTLLSGVTIERGIKDTLYPPNGIHPFYGISLYAMPVCFVHSNPKYAYLTFRELYARYFHRLHSISSRQETLLHLCLTFEKVLKQADAGLFHHLSSTLAYPPLDLAFKWIVYGFVGVLDCEQVLLLWDRMMGFDSLYLLPLTAVALIYYRRSQLLEAETTLAIEVSAAESC
ncbi:hypothetical protein BASA61_008997 [Batrachochytrium salamandrivorans]|nr:hypothetical protein BASA60_006975 [Batrachochytrium salamandrivorans]KAH6581578.1 hypothetical protein BASA61_008997 [Batrachochytrium salamandrivorans]KAJ1330765.1 hypothetical protein BSLG_009217 [Batrachochytrium salamandrivorans]